MLNSAMQYKHTISVTLETQFPQALGLVELVKQILGPWCTEATAVTFNTPLDEESTEK
jgi:hypothetical protein